MRFPGPGWELSQIADALAPTCARVHAQNHIGVLHVFTEGVIGSRSRYRSWWEEMGQIKQI